MNNEPFQPFNQAPQQPEVPTPPSDTNFIVQPPVKKPSKAPLVIAIILGVLFLVAVGIIAYLLFFQPEKSTTPTAQTDSQQIDSEDKAALFIDKVQTSLNEQLKETYKDLAINERTGAPMYNAPSTEYTVFSNDFGTGLSVDPGTANFDQIAIGAIERVATETLANQAELHSSTSSWQKTYQSDAVICTVSIGSSPVSVSCANTKDYATLITQVKPFFEAYTALIDVVDTKVIAFSTPKVTKKTNGYSSASVSIASTKSPVGGFAGLFYAKDGNWMYWKGTQNILPCKDYNSYDLQHAFEGDPCYDAKDEKAVVKVTL